MKLTKNIVALQKGLVVAPDNGCDNKNLVATVQVHLMILGYMMDKETFDALSKSNSEYIVNLHNEVIPYLRNILGGDMDYKPLYKNFPQEVINKSDMELLIGAFMHYLSNGEFEPQTVNYEKPINYEMNIKYNILKFANEDRFNRIFTDLVSINTSIMKQDMNIITWFINNKQPLVFPNVIPFKENLCTLAALGLDVPVKTVTDVLRIAVHMSDGDISLPKVPRKKVRKNIWTKTLVDNPERELFKFKKFTRNERKYILSLMEKTNCDTSEMTLKTQRWIRLGEILHPGEYKNKYPKAYNAFLTIRNFKVPSWYSALNKAFDKSLENGLRVLSQRPGEFSRRIDWLIRTYPDNTSLIMDYLYKAVEGTSNKVLFETYTHFEKRTEPNTSRFVKPKGARIPHMLKPLEALPPKKVADIQDAIKDILTAKFSKLDSLGVCKVDEDLKKIPLPLDMRGMDFTTKPLIRGQRIPIGNPNTKVIRPFVHWYDEKGMEDLDLSITFIGESKVDLCTFQSLKIGRGIIHSGDVRHRQGACAEYVDIDIQFARGLGFKYAVVDVRNYEGDSLKRMNSVFGIMEREFPESNDTWLPKTISRCQHLESSSHATIVSIIDLETMEYIMVDMDSAGTPVASQDIKRLRNYIDIFAENPKFSVYDLIMMHVNGRGSLATEEDVFDTHFKYEDFESSYEETGKLMGI